MARRLYLLRHAKSSWGNRDLDDFDRPLNARGKATRETIVDWFASNNVKPSLVICSPSKRTRQTLKPIKAMWDPRPEIIYDPSIYEASLSALKDSLRHHAGEHRSILMVGHNPGMQMLALDLMKNAASSSSRALEAKFPTGAIASLSTDADAWSRMQSGAFRLNEFFQPRTLMAA